MSLRRDLTKLAAEQPDLRKHLMPLLKAARQKQGRAGVQEFRIFVEMTGEDSVSGERSYLMLVKEPLTAPEDVIPFDVTEILDWGLRRHEDISNVRQVGNNKWTFTSDEM